MDVLALRIFPAVVLISILASACPAASEVSGAAAAYSDLLARVRSSSPPAPIEALFELGMTIADSLGSDLAGFTVLRDGVYEGAIPDLDFFAELSRQHGDAADTAFFAVLAATSPSGITLVYVEQKTDYSGCTRYGTGSLVEAYGAWRAFLGRHPHRYENRAREQVGEVIEELVSGDCACTDRASVARELERFLSRYPRDRASARVRDRLSEVRSGRAMIREHCSPG